MKPQNYDNNDRYKEIIGKLKKQGTHVHDEEKLGMMRRWRGKLKLIDSLAAVLAIAGICIEYYLTQILFYGHPKYTITTMYNSLCYLNIVLTLVLLSCIYYHYITKQRIIRMKRENIETDGFNKNLIRPLILEILVCSVMSLPNVNVKWVGSMRGAEFIYHITDIISIISLLRFYLIFRLYEHYSKWTSFESALICKKYGTEANAIFGIKSDLKDRPFRTIGIIMVLFVIIFGIATMQSEKSYEGKYGDLDQLTNAEWLIIITMTTVGYGDLYPTTHFGRFFCLLACISGMILVSAMVVALNLASEFSKDQSAAYLAIRAKSREQEWIESAAEVVKAAFRAKRADGGPIKKFKAVLMLKKNIFYYKKKTLENDIMDITSSEMLYDLQRKLETKLSTTNSIVCDIPRLKERCDRLKVNQVSIDERMEKIIQQQKVIAGHSNIFGSHSGNK